MRGTKRLDITLADRISSEGVGVNAAEDIAKKNLSDKLRKKSRDFDALARTTTPTTFAQRSSAHLLLRLSPVDRLARRTRSASVTSDTIEFKWRRKLYLP